MSVAERPDLEEVRLAADPSWLGKARGLRALDQGYRLGRQLLYWYLNVYWWLGSGLGGPRSGGKIGPLRSALMRRSARKRVGRRSPEVVPAYEAAARPDGEALAVSGTIRPLQVLAPELHGEGTVYHRVELELKWNRQVVRKYDHLIYEAACDFDLVDARGDAIRVEVARAVLVARPVPLTDYGWAPLERLRALPCPADVRDHLDNLALERSQAGHTRLAAGAEVTVYGWKASVIDQSVFERLERETPTRAVVRSGPQRMLIFPTAEGGRPFEP